MDEAQGERGGAEAPEAASSGSVSYSTRAPARRVRVTVPAVMVLAGILLGVAVAMLLELR